MGIGVGTLYPHLPIVFYPYTEQRMPAHHGTSRARRSAPTLSLKPRCRDKPTQAPPNDRSPCVATPTRPPRPSVICLFWYCISLLKLSSVRSGLFGFQFLNGVSDLLAEAFSRRCQLHPLLWPRTLSTSRPIAEPTSAASRAVASKPELIPPSATATAIRLPRLRPSDTITPVAGFSASA